jgi:beta-xylosidase
MWSWIREDPSHWSLTANPGFLRITTQEGGLLGPANNAKNLLVADAPAGDFIIETRVLFEPMENLQYASLMVYEDEDNYMMLGRAFCGFPPPRCADGNGIYYDHEEEGNFIGGNFATATTILDEAFLLIKRRGDQYTGFYSENGTSWVEIGAHTAISGMVPVKVGFYAADGNQGVTEIPADFDYFWLIDQTYPVYAPITLKS